MGLGMSACELHDPVQVIQSPGAYLVTSKGVAIPSQQSGDECFEKAYLW